MLELQPLSRANWLACANLRLPPHQEGLVAPNVYSIAELNFEAHYTARAVCMADQVVGFLMYCPEVAPPDPQLFWLFRLMIAAKFQGGGFGTRALQLAIDEMWAAGATRIRTMHKPSNFPASKLYRGQGFLEIGMLSDGDVELELIHPHVSNSQP